MDKPTIQWLDHNGFASDAFGYVDHGAKPVGLKYIYDHDFNHAYVWPVSHTGAPHHLDQIEDLEDMGALSLHNVSKPSTITTGYWFPEHHGAGGAYSRNDADFFAAHLNLRKELADQGIQFNQNGGIMPESIGTRQVTSAETFSHRFIDTKNYPDNVNVPWTNGRLPVVYLPDHKHFVIGTIPGSHHQTVYEAMEDEDVENQLLDDNPQHGYIVNKPKQDRPVGFHWVGRYPDIEEGANIYAGNHLSPSGKVYRNAGYELLYEKPEAEQPQHDEQLNLFSSWSLNPHIAADYKTETLHVEPRGGGNPWANMRTPFLYDPDSNTFYLGDDPGGHHFPLMDAIEDEGVPFPIDPWTEDDEFSGFIPGFTVDAEHAGEGYAPEGGAYWFYDPKDPGAITYSASLTPEGKVFILNEQKQVYPVVRPYSYGKVAATDWNVTTVPTTGRSLDKDHPGRAVVVDPPNIWIGSEPGAHQELYEDAEDHDIYVPMNGLRIWFNDAANRDLDWTYNGAHIPLETRKEVEQAIKQQFNRFGAAQTPTINVIPIDTDEHGYGLPLLYNPETQHGYLGAQDASHMHFTEQLEDQGIIKSYKDVRGYARYRWDPELPQEQQNELSFGSNGEDARWLHPHLEDAWDRVHDWGKVGGLSDPWRWFYLPSSGVYVWPASMGTHWTAAETLGLEDEMDKNDWYGGYVNRKGNISTAYSPTLSYGIPQGVEQKVLDLVAKGGGYDRFVALASAPVKIVMVKSTLNDHGDGLPVIYVPEMNTAYVSPTEDYHVDVESRMDELGVPTDVSALYGRIKRRGINWLQGKPSNDVTNSIYQQVLAAQHLGAKLPTVSFVDSGESDANGYPVLFDQVQNCVFVGSKYTHHYNLTEALHDEGFDINEVWNEHAICEGAYVDGEFYWYQEPEANADQVAKLISSQIDAHKGAKLGSRTTYRWAMDEDGHAMFGKYQGDDIPPYHFELIEALQDKYPAGGTCMAGYVDEYGEIQDRWGEDYPEAVAEKVRAALHEMGAYGYNRQVGANGYTIHFIPVPNTHGEGVPVFMTPDYALVGEQSGYHARMIENAEDQGIQVTRNDLASINNPRYRVWADTGEAVDTWYPQDRLDQEFADYQDKFRLVSQAVEEHFAPLLPTLTNEQRKYMTSTGFDHLVGAAQPQVIVVPTQEHDPVYNRPQQKIRPVVYDPQENVAYVGTSDAYHSDVYEGIEDMDRYVGYNRCNEGRIGIWGDVPNPRINWFGPHLPPNEEITNGILSQLSKVPGYETSHFGSAPRVVEISHDKQGEPIFVYFPDQDLVCLGNAWENHSDIYEAVWDQGLVPEGTYGYEGWIEGDKFRWRNRPPNAVANAVEIQDAILNQVSMNVPQTGDRMVTNASAVFHSHASTTPDLALSARSIPIFPRVNMNGSWSHHCASCSYPNSIPNGEDCPRCGSYKQGGGTTTWMGPIGGKAGEPAPKTAEGSGSSDILLAYTPFYGDPDPESDLLWLYNPGANQVCLGHGGENHADLYEWLQDAGYADQDFYLGGYAFVGSDSYGDTHPIAEEWNGNIAPQEVINAVTAFRQNKLDPAIGRNVDEYRHRWIMNGETGEIFWGKIWGGLKGSEDDMDDLHYALAERFLSDDILKNGNWYGGSVWDKNAKDITVSYSPEGPGADNEQVREKVREDWLSRFGKTATTEGWKVIPVDTRAYTSYAPSDRYPMIMMPDAKTIYIGGFDKHHADLMDAAEDHLRVNLIRGIQMIWRNNRAIFFDIAPSGVPRDQELNELLAPYFAKTAAIDYALRWVYVPELNKWAWSNADDDMEHAELLDSILYDHGNDDQDLLDRVIGDEQFYGGYVWENGSLAVVYRPPQMTEEEAEKYIQSIAPKKKGSSQFHQVDSGNAWVYDPETDQIYIGPYHQLIIESVPALEAKWDPGQPVTFDDEMFDLRPFTTPLVLGYYSDVYSDYGDSSATTEQQARGLQLWKEWEAQQKNAKTATHIVEDKSDFSQNFDYVDKDILSFLYDIPNDTIYIGSGGNHHADIFENQEDLGNELNENDLFQGLFYPGDDRTELYGASQEQLDKVRTALQQWNTQKTSAARFETVLVPPDSQPDPYQGWPIFYDDGIHVLLVGEKGQHHDEMIEGYEDTHGEVLYTKGYMVGEKGEYGGLKLLLYMPPDQELIEQIRDAVGARFVTNWRTGIKIASAPTVQYYSSDDIDPDWEWWDDELQGMPVLYYPSHNKVLIGPGGMHHSEFIEWLSANVFPDESWVVAPEMGELNKNEYGMYLDTFPGAHLENWAALARELGCKFFNGETIKTASDEPEALPISALTRFDKFNPPNYDGIYDWANDDNYYGEQPENVWKFVWDFTAHRILVWSDGEVGAGDGIYSHYMAMEDLEDELDKPYDPNEMTGGFIECKMNNGQPFYEVVLLKEGRPDLEPQLLADLGLSPQEAKVTAEGKFVYGIKKKAFSRPGEWTLPNSVPEFMLPRVLYIPAEDKAYFNDSLYAHHHDILERVEEELGRNFSDGEFKLGTISGRPGEETVKGEYRSNFSPEEKASILAQWNAHPKDEFRITEMDEGHFAHEPFIGKVGKTDDPHLVPVANTDIGDYDWKRKPWWSGLFDEETGKVFIGPPDWHHHELAEYIEDNGYWNPNGRGKYVGSLPGIAWLHPDYKEEGEMYQNFFGREYGVNYATADKIAALNPWVNSKYAKVGTIIPVPYKVTGRFGYGGEDRLPVVDLTDGQVLVGPPDGSHFETLTNYFGNQDWEEHEEEYGYYGLHDDNDLISYDVSGSPYSTRDPYPPLPDVNLDWDTLLPLVTPKTASDPWTFHVRHVPGEGPDWSQYGGKYWWSGTFDPDTQTLWVGSQTLHHSDLQEQADDDLGRVMSPQTPDLTSVTWYPDADELEKYPNLKTRAGTIVPLSMRTSGAPVNDVQTDFLRANNPYVNGIPKESAMLPEMEWLSSFVWVNGTLYADGHSYHYDLMERNPEVEKAMSDPSIPQAWGQMYTDPGEPITVEFRSDYLDSEVEEAEPEDNELESRPIQERVDSQTESSQYKYEACRAIANRFEREVRYDYKLFIPGESRPVHTKVAEQEENAFERAIRWLQENGGFTITGDIEQADGNAYFCGVQGYEEVVPLHHVAANVLEEYKNKVIDLLQADPTLMIGGWVSEGLAYFDLSKSFKSLTEAKDFGIQNNQQAIWDGFNNQEVWIGPKVGAYSDRFRMYQHILYDPDLHADAHIEYDEPVMARVATHIERVDVSDDHGNGYPFFYDVNNDVLYIGTDEGYHHELYEGHPDLDLSHSDYLYGAGGDAGLSAGYLAGRVQDNGSFYCFEEDHVTPEQNAKLREAFSQHFGRAAKVATEVHQFDLENNHGGGMPFIYDTELDKLYVGDGEGFHHALMEAAEDEGHDINFSVEDYLGPATYRGRYVAGRADEYYAETYDPLINNPRIWDNLLKALQSVGLAQEQDKEQEDEYDYLGKAGAASSDEMIDVSHLHETAPMNEYKFIYLGLQDKIIMWPTDEFEGPHHYDIIEEHEDRGTYLNAKDYGQVFWVNGEPNYHGPEELRDRAFALIARYRRNNRGASQRVISDGKVILRNQ